MYKNFFYKWQSPGMPGKGETKIGLSKYMNSQKIIMSKFKYKHCHVNQCFSNFFYFDTVINSEFACGTLTS